MNIFKILANGDGSINEPNVSAFLGYLLDPKEEHGLDDILIRKVLQSLYDENTEKGNLNWLIDSNKKIRNLSKNSRFDIEVYFEQAFKIEKKQIVDIVILCYEKNIIGGEGLVVNSLSNSTRELKQIFLIENKIDDKATREGQLKDQYLATVAALGTYQISNIENIVSTIFITPNGDTSEKSFENYKKLKSTNSIHIFWRDLEDDVNSMHKFLKEIMQEELEGKIDPINEYSKHTIKAFIAFIENGFQSKINEDLGKNVNRDIIYDWTEFRGKYGKLLNEQSWKIADNFVNKHQQNASLTLRHSKTHIVSVFQGLKIFSLSRNGKYIFIRLKTRKDDKSIEDIRKDFGEIINHSNVDIVKKEQDFEFKFKNLPELQEVIDKIFEIWLQILNEY